MKVAVGVGKIFCVSYKRRNWVKTVDYDYDLFPSLLGNRKELPNESQIKLALKWIEWEIFWYQSQPSVDHEEWSCLNVRHDTSAQISIVDEEEIIIVW